MPLPDVHVGCAGRCWLRLSHNDEVIGDKTTEISSAHFGNRPPLRNLHRPHHLAERTAHAPVHTAGVPTDVAPCPDPPPQVVPRHDTHPARKVVSAHVVGEVRTLLTEGSREHHAVHTLAAAEAVEHAEEGVDGVRRTAARRTFPKVEDGIVSPEQLIAAKESRAAVRLLQFSANRSKVDHLALQESL